MKRLVVVAAAAAMLAAPTAAGAASVVPPPGGAKEALKLTGDGVQIYACAANGGKFEWAFKGPEANLYDRDGRQVGTHFAGPTWKLEDGSAITAAAVAKAAAPRPRSVEWLLLKVKSHSGSGALAAVEYVRRADTSGGAAPAGGCDAAHAGTTARIHYTAIYQFFTAAR